MYTSFDIYLDYTVADKIFWSCQMDFELSSASDGHSAFLETLRKISENYESYVACINAITFHSHTFKIYIECLVL